MSRRSTTIPATEQRTLDKALVSVIVPSLNQGRFLDAALDSIFRQGIPLEVFVMDGGSKDGSLEVIQKWAPRLDGWRSKPDHGQAAAINEGIARGSAPFVCWLNSDDLYYPGGLGALLALLRANPSKHLAYGRCWAVSERGGKRLPYVTLPFSPRLFANFCFIAQPATLMTRLAWEKLGGLDEQLHMAFDYDLWWRMYRAYGEPAHSTRWVAATRMHKRTKTANNARLHYLESMRVVEKHWGSVPLKWRAFLPFMARLRNRGG